MNIKYYIKFYLLLQVIPKCSVHINQELLFCETCDTVFCTVCTGGNHAGTSPGCTEHTIIPFSIAIKRMSEILLYKANECISKVIIYFYHDLKFSNHRILLYLVNTSPGFCKYRITTFGSFNRKMFECCRY